jgi:cell shape-determining protein MreC
MSVTSVERVKNKVEKLIAAYQSQLTQSERLQVENESLKMQIRDLESKIQNTQMVSEDNEELKQKVNKLIKEVDSCIEMISK